MKSCASFRAARLRNDGTGQGAFAPFRITAVIGRLGLRKDAQCRDELFLFAEGICLGRNFFTHNLKGKCPSSKVDIRDWYRFIPVVLVIEIDS
jgi:hypothetical protein